MPIIERDGELSFVRLMLKPRDIPDLLQRHAENYPGAQTREIQAIELRNGGFRPDEAVKFVRSVCEWGRGHRIIGKVIAGSSAPQVADALAEGYQLASIGNVSAGVERIRQLPFLGLAFASKQLRFLLPSQAIILDSVIRIAIGYRETVDGYAEFLGDCLTVLAYTQQSAQLDPDYRDRLRVCDIEAAVFARIQGY